MPLPAYAIPIKEKEPLPDYAVPISESYEGLEVNPDSENNDSLFQHVVKNFRGGKANMMRSSYGRAAMWGEIPIDKAINQGNREYLKELDSIGKIEEVSFKEHPVRYILGEVANTLPFTIGAMKEGLATGLVTGMGFGAITAVAGQAGPQIATPEELITVPTAFAAGMKVGGSYGVLKFSMDAEGGGIFLDLMENNINLEVARPVSLAAGAISGEIELGQLKLLAAPFKRAFTKTLISKPVKSALLSLMKKYTLAVGGEWSEEIGQEAVALSAEAIAGLLDEKPDTIPTREEITDRLITVAQKSAAAMAALALPGAGVDTVTTIRQMKQDLAVIPIKPAEGEAKPEKPVVTPVEGEEVAPEPIPKGKEGIVEPLVEEAKKFKTAEEFVEKFPIDKLSRVEKTINTALEEIKVTQPFDIMLAGSMAKGIGKPTSDLDVFILTTEKGLAEVRGVKGISIKKALNKEFNVSDPSVAGINMLFVTKEQVKKGENLIGIKNIKQQLTDIWQQAQLKAEVVVTPVFTCSFVTNNISIPEVTVQEKEIDQAIKVGDEQKLLTFDNALVRKRKMTLIKQSLKDVARGIREGKTIAKKEIKDIQGKVIKLFKEANVEIPVSIKSIQTQAQLDEAMPDILARIERIETQKERNILKSKISKELKRTKTKKQAGKIKGKFTPEVQGALDLIKKAMKTDRVEALDIIQKNIDKTTGLIPAEDIALQNDILDLFSDFDNKSIKDLTRILDTITKLKKEGKEAREVLRTERKEHIDGLKQTTIEQITGSGGVIPGRETIGARKTTAKSFKGFLKALGTRWIGQWDTYMDIIEFNAGVESKKLQKLFSTLTQENVYKASEYRFREDFDNAILEAYEIKSKKEGFAGTAENTINVHKKINDLSKEVNLGKFKNADGVEVELIFTKDELIKKWMELQDESLRESFEKGNKYTSEIISAIEKNVTDKDKAFARAQFAMYKEQWKRLNPLYRKFFGVDLTFSEFYSPIAREGYRVDATKGLNQLIEDTSFRVGITAKSLKARVKNFLPLKTRSSIYALDNHMKETNYFMAWAEKIREMEAVFKDSQVKEAINQEFPTSVYSAIVTKIEHLANKGNINALKYPGIDFLRKGFTVGRLMLKPALTIKQFVSTVAYYEKVGIADFVTGAVDFWFHPIKNYKTLQKESIFIRTRGAGMERDIKAATEAGLTDKFFTAKSITNLLLLNNRLGDKGAIVWGSWILRRSRLNQNVNLDAIISEYEEFSANTQQSADISRLSEVQLGGSIERLFTMFKTSQRQYLAKELNAVRSLFQKGGTSAKNITKVAKTMLIYHVLLPVMFQFIANGGGWDEDDQKEYLRAGLLGSLNGLFIFGDAIDSILRKALGLRVFNLEVPILSVTTSVKRALGKIDWDDILLEDVLEALSSLSEAGDSFYLPVSTVKNFAAGVADVQDGNVRKGILEMLGWSKYILEGKKKKKVYR